MGIFGINMYRLYGNKVFQLSIFFRNFSKCARFTNFSYQGSFSAFNSFNNRSRSSRFERISRTFRYQKGFSAIRKFFCNQKFSWNQILAILQKTELYFHTTCTLCRQLQRQASVARMERVIPPGSPAARLRQALSSRCVSDASPLARHRSYHPPSHSAPAAGIVIVSRQ